MWYHHQNSETPDLLQWDNLFSELYTIEHIGRTLLTKMYIQIPEICVGKYVFDMVSMHPWMIWLLWNWHAAANRREISHNYENAPKYYDIVFFLGGGSGPSILDDTSTSGLLYSNISWYIIMQYNHHEMPFSICKHQFVWLTHNVLAIRKGQRPLDNTQ